ncbi:MAG: Xaa-Pro peptidase family protein [Anaerolineales bacterium]
MSNQRLERLRRILTERSLDALVLLPGPSLFYLTGVSFHLFERPILGFFPVEGQPVLVLPELERAKGETTTIPVKMFTYAEDPNLQVEAIADAFRALGLAGATVGVEPLRMRMNEMELLGRVDPDLRLQAADDVTVLLRAIKAPEEVAAMRTAVDIAEAALRATLPLVKIGMTERELSAELVVQLLHHGSDPELPFQPIIASGPNSALPHATSSSRQLAAGDSLLIDWGASHQGYLSDLTRTFAVAEARPELAMIHQAVQASNLAGREAAGPGVACEAVDQAARDEIESAGYGELFIHRTGHGLGLEEHEAPYIRAGNQSLLAPGMTFTIEPGIYQQRFAGVRIEDDILVTEAGSESLSSFPRELQVVG